MNEFELDLDSVLARVADVLKQEQVTLRDWHSIGRSLSELTIQQAGETASTRDDLILATLADLGAAKASRQTLAIAQQIFADFSAEEIAEVGVLTVSHLEATKPLQWHEAGRQELLKTAADQGWGVRQLRAEVKRRRLQIMETPKGRMAVILDAAQALRNQADRYERSLDELLPVLESLEGLPAAERLDVATKLQGLRTRLAELEQTLNLRGRLIGDAYDLAARHAAA